ncbi:MAG TPA: M28 family peptidase [Syntrophobacteria bacterium]|nr:M28 family peptidase [Syntrophobacteria bacterium]
MNELSGTSILATIEEICSFGTRWMGGEGAEKTRDYVVSRFRNVGLAAELQPFPYLHYQPISALLTIGEKSLPCQPIALAPSTAKPLDAPLVYGGQCTKGDLGKLKISGVDLRDTIVLSENLRSFVAYPEVEAAGAAGFISLTTLPDNTIRCGCARLDGKVGAIPAVAVGGVDARDLVGRLAAGEPLRASIQTQGRIEERTGHNVIGRRPGASSPKLLITAHYDCFWNGVMAMDNCAGVAAVLALSGVLPSSLRNVTEFVVFGGEELGCWGSSGYVQDRRESLGHLRAIVNLDTFGSNRSKLEIGATRDLEEMCRRVVKEREVAVECWNIPPRPASDHQRFIEQGVSAVWLANCGTDPRYHTPLDVPAEMSPENLEVVATLAYTFATGLVESC